jgi:large subunit ribosomal protein L31
MLAAAGKRSASTLHACDEGKEGMRKGIHPKYYPEAKVVCSCGNTFTTGSTKELIRTDVCSACHPFFTGEQRIVDTAGQVERFMKRLEKREEFAAKEKVGLEEAEEAADEEAEALKKKQQQDETEAAKAIAEKLRGKRATVEKAPKEASEKPAGKAAKSAVSEESGKAAD